MTTMSNREVAERFADGIWGRSKHMFIQDEKERGLTVYSYGLHFPIARHYKGNVYLFNSNNYSPTTTSHKNLVWRALADRGFTIIAVPSCNINNALDIFVLNESEINEIKDKLKGVRSDSVRKVYERNMLALIQQNKLLQKFIPHVVANKL